MWDIETTVRSLFIDNRWSYILKKTYLNRENFICDTIVKNILLSISKVRYHLSQLF